MIIAVGTQPDPRDRVHMRLSRADGDAVMNLGPTDTVEVLDLATGVRAVLRRADCGLGCRCAVEFVDEPDHAPGRSHSGACTPHGSRR